jgi:uncharacterized protein YrrD
MLRKNKELTGSKLAAVDGEIGHVKDFYFDDQTWTVRYLVADTGHWLPDRRVLLSPFAVSSLETHPHKVLALNLTKKQIENSPSMEEHKPISRQYEQQYMQYYGWPDYWPGPLLWGPVEAPWAYLPATVQAPPPHPKLVVNSEDAHLRSAREISGFSGYQIQALDQLFGHVEDFIFDEQTWAIRYLVCDTRNWWPGKHFLLAPQWLAWESWAEARVYVDLDREAIRRGPEYDPSVEINRAFEQKLFEHYNREPYWMRRSVAEEAAPAQATKAA